MLKLIETEGFYNFDWQNKVVPWHLVEEPYLHYETANCTGKHSLLKTTYLNCANGFDPSKPVAFIKTKKGTDLLVNTSKDKDHKIGLVTIKSNLPRAGFSLFGSGIRVLKRNEYTMIHCAANISLAVEFLKDDSAIFVDIGDGNFNHRYQFITWDTIEYHKDDTRVDALSKFFLPKQFTDISIVCTDDEQKKLENILNPLNDVFGDDLSVKVVLNKIRYLDSNSNQFDNLSMWFFWKGRFLLMDFSIQPYYVFDDADITKKLIEEISEKINCL